MKKDEILKLEMELLDPSVRKTLERLNILISREFIEFGKSGKQYTKADVLKLLAVEQERNIEINNFAIKELADKVVLATYMSIEEGEIALRSSIWKFSDNHNQWQVIFHQGTVGQK